MILLQVEIPSLRSSTKKNQNQLNPLAKVVVREYPTTRTDMVLNTSYKKRVLIYIDMNLSSNYRHIFIANKQFNPYVPSLHIGL
jgi:hypothetical protein